jgi:broad specificity phosphatase PhoE
VKHPGLREFSVGQHEAAPESEFFARVDPIPLFRSVIAGTFAGLPGGEPGSVDLARVAPAFTALEAAHPEGGDVLVVSHGITLMAYLTMVVGAPRRPLANASVSMVAWWRCGPGVTGASRPSARTRPGRRSSLRRSSFRRAGGARGGGAVARRRRG